MSKAHTVTILALFHTTQSDAFQSSENGAGKRFEGAFDQTCTRTRGAGLGKDLVDILGENEGNDVEEHGGDGNVEDDGDDGGDANVEEDGDDLEGGLSTKSCTRTRGAGLGEEQVKSGRRRW